MSIEYIDYLMGKIEGNRIMCSNYQNKDILTEYLESGSSLAIAQKYNPYYNHSLRLTHEDAVEEYLKGVTYAFGEVKANQMRPYLI